MDEIMKVNEIDSNGDAANNADADADADALTPISNTQINTRRSVPSSLGRSFST